MLLVTVDGKYGLINMDGKETLAPIFDSLKPLDVKKEK